MPNRVTSGRARLLATFLLVALGVRVSTSSIALGGTGPPPPLAPGVAAASPGSTAPRAERPRRMVVHVPSVDFPEDSVSAPFDASSGHVVVDVDVNGRGPYSFVLDTGGMGHGRIDPALARELALPVVGDARAADGTLRNSRPVDLVRIDSLRVGDALFRDVVVAAVAMRRPPPPPGAPPPPEPTGILGFGLFEKVLLTIDSPRSRLVLRRGALDPSAPHTIPLLGDLDIARAPIEVDDVALDARLDTGNMGGLTVAPDVLEKLKPVGQPWVVGKARSLNNAFDVRGVRLSGPLRVAGFRFDVTEASYVDIFRGTNLGYAVLRNFAITFDQQERLVTFTRDGDGRLEALARRREREAPPK